MLSQKAETWRYRRDRPQTVHRADRLHAQRLHEDSENRNATQFRLLSEAYQVIGDAEKRAGYDVVHAQRRQERWRLISSNDSAGNDFEAEQLVRLTLLEVLYTRRRIQPENPSLSPLDLEGLIGRPREQLEFTTWYLIQKKYVSRSDNSALVITAEGVECLESNFRENLQRRRLNPAPERAA